MIRNRRLLAWVVFVSLVCLGLAVAVRAIWPGVSDFIRPSGGGGFGAVSVAFPMLSSVPFVIGNIALSVLARRRGGRPASIGTFCLWIVGLVAVLTLAVSLTPPAVVEKLNSVFFFSVLLVLSIAGSLPMQLIILALLMFVLIGGSRTPLRQE
jgi:hypothetical protein